jgi:hypothetical protein
VEFKIEMHSAFQKRDSYYAKTAAAQLIIDRVITMQ